MIGRMGGVKEGQKDRSRLFYILKPSRLFLRLNLATVKSRRNSADTAFGLRIKLKELA